MACELAGHFYLGLGETVESMKHFLRAHERYKEWVSIVIDSESLVVLLKYFDFVANFNRRTFCPYQRELWGSANSSSNFLRLYMMTLI
jgi:hypothetical protein